MHPRFGSIVLVFLGCADLTVENFVLVPRVARGRSSAPEEAQAAESHVSAPKAPTPTPPPDTGRSAAVEDAAVGVALRPAAPDIAFVFGEDAFSSPYATADLHRIAKELRESPDVRLLVRGHADRLGTPLHNQVLGRLRAEAVARYLVLEGAPRDRIDVETAGDLEPADRTDTPVGWARNRRVQLFWR